MHADNQNLGTKASLGADASRAGNSPNHESNGHVTGSSTAAAESSEVPPPKWFVWSKTILGAFVGLLPHLLGALGYEFNDAEIQAIANKGAAFLCAILVVWGRATAKRPIALNRKNPYDAGRLWILGAVTTVTLSGCSTVGKVFEGIKITGQVCYEPTPGVSVCTDGSAITGKVKRDGVSAKAVVPLRNSGGTK